MQARSLPLFFVPLASYAQRGRLLQFHVLQARSVTALETAFLPLSIAMLDIIALVVAQQPPKSNAMPGITVQLHQKLRFLVISALITLM
jgi:hypothetical protein